MFMSEAIAVAVAFDLAVAFNTNEVSVNRAKRGTLRASASNFLGFRRTILVQATTLQPVKAAR